MKQTYPLISVVMCTYNGEKYLAPQLDSILAQTYPNFDVVICDDASADSTVTQLNDYRTKNKQIQVYENIQNLGYNKNFEQAANLAKGEWIAIADQDDIWLPGKLMELYKCTASETLLVHSYNAEFKDNDSSKTFVNKSRIRFKGKNTRELFFYNTISGHTILFRKQLLQAALPFPEGVYYDWWLGIQASLQSKVQLHPEALVLHRQHESNSSHQKKELTAEESKAAFFADRLHTLKKFSAIKTLFTADKKLLGQFIDLLQRECRKSFSFPIFFFFLRHARSAFYYRKKSPMIFYYVKYSLKRASMKVKNWT